MPNRATFVTCQGVLSVSPELLKDLQRALLLALKLRGILDDRQYHQCLQAMEESCG